MGHNGDDDRSISTALPRTILSLMLILCGIVFCLTTLIVTLDTVCNMHIDRWLPLYPGAEEVTTQFDFVRPRGVGNTFIIFYSPDDITTVQEWYGDYRRKLISESADQYAVQSLASTSYRILKNPDGTGTLIYHISQCTSN
jgi:hypothetical protein